MVNVTCRPSNEFGSYKDCFHQATKFWRRSFWSKLFPWVCKDWRLVFILFFSFESSFLLLFIPRVEDTCRIDKMDLYSSRYLPIALAMTSFRILLYSLLRMLLSYSTTTTTTIIDPTMEESINICRKKKNFTNSMQNSQFDLITIDGIFHVSL